MELHQLRYLVAVAETGTFTAAAGREHLSQSGVSAQIAKLERELGQILLDRTRRAAVLTATGEAILPLAKTVLHTVAEITEVADSASKLLRGRVRLGMITGCAIPPFLDALTDLRRDHPGVELSLTEGASNDLQAQVRTGLLDLALIGLAGEPGDLDDGLRARVVLREPLVAAMAPDHPLAGEPVSLRELEREHVLLLTRGTGIRDAFDRSCRDLGIEPPSGLEASSPETILGLAERGAGIAVVSASMAVGPGVVSQPLVDASVQAGLALVTREARIQTAADALLEALTVALDPGSRYSAGGTS